MLPYIKVFRDMTDTIDLLADEEAGRLLKAILHYANGQAVELPGQERLIFAMMKTQMDRDEESYRLTCEKRRENGLKGGRPKTKDNQMVNEETNENQMVISKSKKSQDKDKEEDKEKDNDKDKDYLRKAASRFIPPTSDEVFAYCLDKGFDMDADAFIDFYQSKGWKVGSQPMKDWRAAVRNWMRHDNKPQKVKGPKTVNAQQYEQRKYTEDELASLTDDPIIKALERKYGA